MSRESVSVKSVLCPEFVDVVSGNYSLMPSSPCIDSGTDDINGDGISDTSDYYGSAPDMGTYEHQGSAVQGDLNGDNAVNVLDIITLINIILAEEYITQADVNTDGEINILDVVVLVNIIISSEDLPVGCYVVPEVGTCLGICPTYFFNQGTSQCEEFITGCCGVEAFGSMIECQSTCE